MPSLNAPIDSGKTSDPIVQNESEDVPKVASSETSQEPGEPKSECTERTKKSGVSMKSATFDGTSSWIVTSHILKCEQI